jgi:hypothetical protein
MLTAALLQALSFHQLPALQEIFESPAGARNVNLLLAKTGYTMEELQALVDLIADAAQQAIAEYDAHAWKPQR